MKIFVLRDYDRYAMITILAHSKIEAWGMATAQYDYYTWTVTDEIDPSKSESRVIASYLE